MRIVLATRNRGKIAEIGELLSRYDPDLEVLGLDDFPGLGTVPETGSTFRENALLKARAVAEHTGLVSLADDSGLEVDALDGAPGVYSARYSGEGATDEANNAKLQRRMREAEADSDRARFRCVLAAYAPGGDSLLAEGTWEGRIVGQPRGEHGFGYDPLFEDPDTGLTAAEMDRERKNLRSHRAKALQSLLQQWPGFVRAVNQRAGRDI
jgi:XTP/dITP diphosphohydrolase